MKKALSRLMVPIFYSFLLLSLLLLIGCGGGGGGGGGDGDVVYVPPDSSTGVIDLINNSVVTIDGFYLALVDQRSWGPNILTGPLFPEQYTSIVDIYSDYYDAKIRAAGVYSDYFGYLYDIPIAAGDVLTLNVYNSSFTGSLEIRNNNLGANIMGVYVVPANAPTWGANQTSLAIGPAGSLHLSDLETGFYDVRVVWDIGPDSIEYDIRVDSLTLTTLNVD